MIDSNKKSRNSLYIVSSSKNDSTARYAKLLYYETDLAVYSLEEAIRTLPAQSEIIYLGWIRRGRIEGYKEAKKRFRIQAVCAVSVDSIGTGIEDIRKKNAVSEQIPVFPLQGNSKAGGWGGIYRRLINAMGKKLLKALLVKENRVSEEDEILDMIFCENGNVKPENLDMVVDWYNANYEWRKMVPGGN